MARAPRIALLLLASAAALAPLACAKLPNATALADQAASALGAAGGHLVGAVGVASPVIDSVGSLMSAKLTAAGSVQKLAGQKVGCLWSGAVLEGAGGGGWQGARSAPRVLRTDRRACVHPPQVDQRQSPLIAPAAINPTQYLPPNQPPPPTPRLPCPPRPAS